MKSLIALAFAVIVAVLAAVLVVIATWPKPRWDIAWPLWGFGMAGAIIGQFITKIMARR